MKAELRRATHNNFLFVLQVDSFEEVRSMNVEEVATFFEVSPFLGTILQFVQQSRPGESLRITRDGTIFHCGLPTHTHRPAAHKVFVPADQSSQPGMYAGL